MAINTKLDTETQKNVDAWLKGDYDTKTKNEILKLLQENPKEIVNAFYREMSFGTGGLRGLMGVGTNRMNVYTVRAATQGLANYISKQPFTDKKKVFIGFDCRHNSALFAEEAARVFAANDIEVFLYKELRPVASLSFGVLYKGCIAGVMITASHNPPQYNGYKIYWSYGGQILPPHDQGIIEEMRKKQKHLGVPQASFSHPLIHQVAEEIDSAYLEAIKNWQLHPAADLAYGSQLKVVYTNLHGSGITLIPKALRNWGFNSLTLVEEQQKPDGNFPTVASPNPEEPEAMRLGEEKLRAISGDILLGTDPDTDRLGVVVMHQGEAVYLDGNQTACLLLESLCRTLQQTQAIPKKAICVKTIVTTELFREIAKYYGIDCLDVLTGFKYIGEKIHQWEEQGDGPQFLFGAEESYGYLLGTHVRDKDAVIAAASICEAALQMKLQRKTLVDLLHEIYQKYGIFREKLTTLAFEGKEGAEKMRLLLENFRNNPPKTVGEVPVRCIEDYLTQTLIHIPSGKKEPITLPQSDVLRIWLEDKTKIAIRPSGTEPKIKIYCAVQENPSPQPLANVLTRADQKLEKILSSFQRLL